MDKNNIQGKILEPGDKTGKSTQQKFVSIYKHIIIALLLFFCTSIFIESLGLTFFSCLFAIIWCLTRRERNGYTVKIKLFTIGIYVMMLVMTFGMKNINNRVAYKNAKTIIEACEQYKSKNGVYPDRLNDLVPDYLRNIPTARYTGTGGWRYFHYSNKESNEAGYYLLSFTYESPFGRHIYRSSDKKWRTLD